MQYWKWRRLPATRKEESFEWRAKQYGPGYVEHTWRKTGVIVNGEPQRAPDVVREWDRAFFVQVGRIRRDTDVITGIDERLVIRDKFRSVIEEIAPGQTQFLPVTVMIRGRPVQNEQFWIWHWPIVVDCIDIKCNEAIYYREQKKYAIRGKWTIDARRVPEGLHVFAPKHVEHVAVVSDPLKRALQKTGRGFWFDRLTSVEGPSFKGKTPTLASVMPKDLPEFGPATPKQDVRPTPEKPKPGATAVEMVRWLVAASEAKAHGAAKKKDVDAISKTLKIDVPQAYLDVIAEFGSVSVSSHAEEILGVPDERGRGGAIRATQLARSQEGVDWPASMLCVAEDGTGGWVCLDTSQIDGDECAVVYYDHERCTVNKKTGLFVPKFRKVSPTIAGWVRRAMSGRALVPEYAG